MTASTLTLFEAVDVAPRGPADHLPRTLAEVPPKNRRFTDARLWKAPLALHGRQDTGWDLDAAAEDGGTVAPHYITVEDDALGGADWPTFLGLRWQGVQLRGTKRPAELPLVWLNGPFSTPKGWPGRTGWKDAWVTRATEQAALGLLVWMLFPFTALPAIRQLEEVSDCQITTSGWRPRFRSPCGLEEVAPKPDVYLIARIPPPGFRDILTHKSFRLTEDGLVWPSLMGRRSGRPYNTRWRER